MNLPKVNLMNNNDLSGPFVMQHIEHSVKSLHFKGKYAISLYQEYDLYTFRTMLTNV